MEPGRHIISDTLPRSVIDKDREICTKARIGQGGYRPKMIEIWEEKCAVTGCAILSVLRASHAKPWKDSDDVECRDPYNGLLLSPNLDALFGQGLIAFDGKGKIIISAMIDRASLAQLGVNEEMTLRMLKLEHQKYLQYHREHVFQG